MIEKFKQDNLLTIFPSLESFLEYCYTDIMCNTDSLDYGLCKSVLYTLGVSPEMFVKLFKQHLSRRLGMDKSNIEDGTEIPNSRELPDEADFLKYCTFMFHVNLNKMPVLKHGTLIEVNYDGKMAIGRSVCSFSEEHEPNGGQSPSNNLVFVYENGDSFRCDYPNTKIISRT